MLQGAGVSRVTEPASFSGFFAARVELEMRLVRFEPYRLVEYTSQQRGLPDARHWRHFDEADGELAYRIAVAYQPRSGWRSLFDRHVVRRAIERSIRETMANLDRRFGERSSQGRLSERRK
jgi:hypothetical protein